MINILTIFAIGYSLSLLLVFLLQRKLIYYPSSNPPPKEWVFISNIEELFLETDDELKLVAWLAPPKNDKPIIVHFHGNASDIGSTASKIQQLAHRGYGLFLPEYRGYGGNKGKPSEKNLTKDAALAIKYLHEQGYDNSQIVVYGESLGTAVATALAKNFDFKAVILESPFTSVVDLAKEIYWYFPVSLMVKDSYRSDLKIKDINSPILLIHGDKDETVPVEHSQKLFAIANEPKTLKIIETAKHNNLFQFGLIDIVDDWLKSLSQI